MRGPVRSTYKWVKRSVGGGRTKLKGVVLCHNTLDLAHSPETFSREKHEKFVANSQESRVGHVANHGIIT